MPQMSNRKFRIIMQTVCIFRGYCSRLSGAKTTHTSRRRKKDEGYRMEDGGPNSELRIQSSWSFDFPLCLSPLLIIIEFLENSSEKRKKEKEAAFRPAIFAFDNKDNENENEMNELLGHHSLFPKSGLHCIIQRSLSSVPADNNANNGNDYNA